MFTTKQTQSQDKGVSPVIGVILMVAITVILAAVIGTFVLDLAGGLEQNASASVTFDEDTSAGTVTVQAVSMQNADSLDVTRSDQAESAYLGELGAVGQSVTVGDATNGSNEGATGTFADPALQDGDTITVTATLDGNTTVIQTHTFG